MSPLPDIDLPEPSHPKTCIFCGGPPPLTKEHIWADWLKKYIPRDMASHTYRSTIEDEANVDSRVKKRPGDPRSSKVRVVCKSCNGGWMSRLQSRAKPILIPLVVGDKIVLDRFKQETLTAWIAMAVMCSEFFQAGRAAISPLERERFYKTTTIGKNWKIWIGNYQRGDWVGHWVHLVSSVGAEDSLPYPTAGGRPQPNTQSTTMVVGQLYINVVSSAVPELIERWDLSEHGTRILARIHPVQETFIAWPISILSDKIADGFAAAFYNFQAEVGRRIATQAVKERH